MTYYESNGEQSLFIKKAPPKPKDDAQNIELNVDESKTYQTIHGFGGSFTDSAAYLINQVLDKKQNQEVMEGLFCPKNGIGLSAIRNPMGASDYARNFYNYNIIPEGETDPDLIHFSIAPDLEDILPLTKRAVEINPEILLLASPWSPPGWMKTSRSMIGGELREECYEVYARYFVKFIKAYAERGVKINVVTPQNEPLYVPSHYPGMHLPAYAAAIFIRDYLRPAFIKNNLDVKILCYDHNWDRADYPLQVLEEAGDAADGVAWHWYGGRASAQTHVAKVFPNKETHFTEGSGGEWIPPFEPAFSNLMRTCIEIMKNGAISLVLWNMALDENNGPFVPGFGTSTCRGIVKVNQSKKEYEYTLDYYGLAHFSKFIRPGALRLEANGCALAAKNTDNSRVLVAFNDSEKGQNIKTNLGGEITEFYLPAGAAGTLVKG